MSYQENRVVIQDSSDIYEDDLDIRHVDIGVDGIVNEIEIIGQMDR